MIKEIVLDNKTIKYQITFKKNKNTYFYFKKSGYIQINASRYQRKKDIIKFMKNNSKSFIKKYSKMFEFTKEDHSYRIWGNEYKIIQNNELMNIRIDHESFTIYEPSNSVNNKQLLYKKIEKDILLKEAKTLKEKYLDNGFIDISNITIKTRYTNSRFGSCNYRLRTVNLNLKLVYYDKKFIEYVFLHEIAHLVHQNHSKDFYLLLSKLSSNYKEIKIELNKKFKR